MAISKIIEPMLRPFDNEQRELILRWRLWKMKWFPYRTAEFKGWNEENNEIIVGPWKWNKPNILRKNARG